MHQRSLKAKFNQTLRLEGLETPWLGAKELRRKELQISVIEENSKETKGLSWFALDKLKPTASTNYCYPAYDLKMNEKTELQHPIRFRPTRSSFAVICAVAALAFGAMVLINTLLQNAFLASNETLVHGSVVLPDASALDREVCEGTYNLDGSISVKEETINPDGSVTVHITTNPVDPLCREML